MPLYASLLRNRVRPWSGTVFVVVAVAVAAGLSTVSSESVAEHAQAKVYRDPVGDAGKPCGDITRFDISDSRGIVTFAIHLKGLRCLVNVEFYPEWSLSQAAAGEDYGCFLRFERDLTNPIDFNRFFCQDDTGLNGRPLLGASRKGEAYTFRFRAAALDIRRSVRFDAFLQDGYDTYDPAPNGGGRYLYRLTSASR